MSDNPIDDDRTFTDREVREILKRAVERSPGSRAVATQQGLSLSELKAIGAEVGIDPARLEEAARTVVSGGGTKVSTFVGAPLTLHFERRVKGELGPDATPEVLSVIRRVTGHQGKAQDIHGSLEWNGNSEPLTRFVTVSAKDGITTIRSAVDLRGLAMLSYGVPGMMGALSSAIAFIAAMDDGSAGGVLAALLIVPVIYVVVRTIVGAVGRKEAEKMERVVDELARLAEASGE